MREVQIFHELDGQPKHMIGALWVRGDIEISKDGVLASCATKSAATSWDYHRDRAQLCMTLPGKISYVMAMGGK